MLSLSLSLPSCCHRCCCCHVVVVVTAAVTAVVVAVATVVVVIASSLCRGRGRTMVGTATSPSARRLEARRAWGAAKEGYKREKENYSYVPRSRVAEGLRAVQSLRPSLLLDHGWALEGEDGHLRQQGGSRMGEHGELLSEIANEKRKIPNTRVHRQPMSRSMSVSVIARQRRRCGARRRVASGP